MWYLVVLLVFQFVLQFPSPAFTIVYCFNGAVGLFVVLIISLVF